MSKGKLVIYLSSMDENFIEIIDDMIHDYKENVFYIIDFASER